MGRWWAGIGTLSAILCGCSATPGSGAGAAMLAARAASSSGNDLLYVSDWSAGKIFIVTYPGGSPVATISDDQYPLGLCSDANGNVWVTNFGASSDQVVEYAHGGTSPIAELDDPNAEPRGCSVDPVTGDLAVANGEPSNVAIYPKGGATPEYYDPKLEYPVACGYDSAGDLFVDGYHVRTSDKFALSELPAGANLFEPIAIKAPIGSPGGLQWDGSDLAAGDSASPNVVHRLHVFTKSKKAKLVSTVTLDGPTRQPPNGVQFWLLDGVLVMPFGTGKHVSKVGLWNYPAGGQYTAALGGFGTGELYGVTVSLSPGRANASGR